MSYGFLCQIEIKLIIKNKQTKKKSENVSFKEYRVISLETDVALAVSSLSSH